MLSGYATISMIFSCPIFKVGGCIYAKTMPDDQQLLKRFVENRSEAAFSELVGRYVNLVYSTALRRTNHDTHLAQDVAQLVFTDLARKAPSLSRDVVLAGWLHRATRYAAAQMMRSDRRRRLREQEAAAMTALESETHTDWHAIRPELDDALDRLSQTDRDAILLRFFEQRSLAEIGSALGTNEDTARKRVSRALDKLRAVLIRKGLTTTAATLSAAISTHAVQLAPAGLAASLTSASLASATTAAGITSTLLKIMSMTKLQLGVASLVLAGATTALIVQHRSQAELQNENKLLRQRVAQVRAEYDTLSNRAAQTLVASRLSLPAPRIQSAPASPAPLAPQHSTDLIARLNRGEKAPTLTPEQAEAYLKQNRRSAESLLAAYRATGDARLLEEAMEKFPDNAQVAFTAAYKKDASPEERRHWLDLFARAAPDNALPSYLSALEHFKAGESDQAVQDLTAATGKRNFQDYSWDFIQNGEEAYRAAGYPEVEARIIPSMALILPHLADFAQLNQTLINLAVAYRQAGDDSSARAALQLDASMGERLRGPTGTPLITQLVGFSIEGLALKQMDPASIYGTDGQTVKDVLDNLSQRRTTLNQLSTQLDAIYQSISTEDWISYHDRWQTFGEENATRWLLNKYAQN
jgi:RNA polymerase sigma factor (sigma-70 family)